MQAFLADALVRGDARLSAVRWLDDCPPGSLIPGEVVQVLLPHLLPPFAATFPTGPTGAVLHAAIRYAPSGALERWIESVLSTPGVTAPERAIALTASLVHSDRRFDALLRVLAGDRHSAAACCQIALQPSPRTILDRLPIALIGRLVEALGCLVEPRHDAIFWMDEKDRIRMGVSALLAELVARTGSSAALELDRLRALPSLAPWYSRLSDSLQRSAARMRKASYDPLDPLAVAAMLSNRAPANERDLIAVVLAHVDTVMRRIRHGDTNILRTFWRINDKDKHVPVVENDCRDRFLHELRRDLLPLDIHIGPEVMTGADKRADMAITVTRDGRHISVPVEVKLDCHKAVWHAWDTQLMGLYATDPDAGKYGVYLVLFTGHGTRRPPGGRSPRSAEAMAQAFDELIPARYHGLLHGMVLDFSWPDHDRSRK